MASPVIIAPSILAANYAEFGAEAARAEKGGGDWLHVDIMDGHFVKNISFGPAVTAALKKSTKLPLDVHLMIERPDLYLEAFVKAGSFRISVHVEAKHDVRETLRRIRESGCKAGIAFNPATPSSSVEPYLEEVDLVVCMTVVPGFGGQAFMPEALEKVRYLAQHPFRKKNGYHLEVDGGINRQTAIEAAKAGANAFVAGTSLFGAKDFAQEVSEMRKGVLEFLPKA
jgi:ribulose-phosphate 3-epimerase